MEDDYLYLCCLLKSQYKERYLQRLLKDPKWNFAFLFLQPALEEINENRIKNKIDPRAFAYFYDTAIAVKEK